MSRLRTSYLGVEGDSMICRRQVERGREERTGAGFMGGKCSEIRAVQGFDESPHELLSLCNAGK